MPVVSYDAQSLMVDGRRVWLVSGTIEYARIPRGQWRAAIRAAREAGLNCIMASIPWRLHEPLPRRFRFEGELDLRHFLSLVAAEGMYAILRPGPYVGNSFESGGLPGWLSTIAEMKVREASRPFLDACTRWFGAVMEQVRDYQVTAERGPAGAAGPVLLMQIEHEWFCSNGDQAVKYLGELIRYLREEGCGTPLIEANNCWQEVEGAFATWHGGDELAANMRQFRVVQRTPPVQQFPLFVSEYRLDTGHDGDGHVQRLAQAMAAGAMINIETACAPVHGGRATMAESRDDGALIDPRGNRTALFAPIRRLAMFAQQFGHVFASLHADRAHAAVLPGDEGVTILHQHGTQGDITFLLRGEGDTTPEANVLMPDGQTLTIPLGDDRAAWFASNVNLAGVAELTYTNLRPFAFIDRRLLVLFGPAGAAGVVCIDGATVDVTVPKASELDSPAVQRLDGVSLVVLNDEQVDASHIAATGLIVGAAAVNEAGEATAMRGFRQPVLIKPDGTVEKLTAQKAAGIKANSTPRLSAWLTAECGSLCDGSDTTYQSTSIGAGLGATAYGWYRLMLAGARPGSNLLAPHWAGRLRAFTGGKPIAALGDGGIAVTQPFAMKLARDVVLLAGGGEQRAPWRLGEPRGPAGALYHVKPVKLGKPRVGVERAPDPTAWRAFLPEVAYHYQPLGDVWEWTIKPAGRLALIVRIGGLPRRALLIANGKPVGGYDPQLSGGESVIVLEVGKQITAGRNEIALAFFETDDSKRKIEPRRFMTVHDAAANVTAKSEWSFAPLSMPKDDAFAAKAGGPRGQPRWYRATFTGGAAAALELELRGVSAGRVWINGHDLGGYAEATNSKPPRVPLPGAWLNEGENIVTIFDEEGRPPRGCRIVSAK